MSESDGFNEEEKGLSIAGFVLGILSLLVPFLGTILGIIGIVLSAIALKNKQGIKGLAIAGLILSIISVGLWVLILLFAGIAVLAVLGLSSALVAGM